MAICTDDSVILSTDRDPIQVSKNLQYHIRLPKLRFEEFKEAFFPS